MPVTEHQVVADVKPLIVVDFGTMNALANFDDYQWLVSPSAEEWLEQAATHDGELVSQTAMLRRRLSAARTHLLLEQATLRVRARRKFSAAARMFFTPLALAQATDEWVAAYKASRFLSAAPLVDLCCGIGGDLLALARRGPVIGIDHDPVAALLAQVNLAAVLGDASGSFSSAIEVRDAAHASLAGAAAWHIDPDRRSTGQRATRVELHSPGVPALERLLRVCPAAAIKLAPAAELPPRWTAEAELEWISRGGECRQLVAWFGSSARTPGCRRATVVVSRETSSESEPSYHVRTFVGDPNVELPVADRLGRYLAEPDASVLAARLTATLAAEHGLAAVAPGTVYLTGQRANADPALAWFEVSDVLPFDLKRLKSLLRGRGIGRLEVKKRGVPHDPAQVLQQLRVPGDQAATLFLTRITGAVTAIICRRL
ncbi:MAG TPA: class I SAM-dependent methyltransferase [Pirellulales bacterium]|nr:class I SAM-dependent methyltransferase [Pirellulales bacterium]